MLILITSNDTLSYAGKGGTRGSAEENCVIVPTS